MTKEEALRKIKELEEYIESIDKKVGYKDDPIFLLSKDEYEKYKGLIPKRNWFWWLRSPGLISNYAAYVSYDGSLYDYGNCVNSDYGAVCPALKLSESEMENLQIGDRFVKLGCTWQMIDDGLAISVMPIAFRRFDDKSNDYENSEIRKWLLEWCEKGGMEYDE